jgi:polar amino acid transport system substrate-binding protein
LSPASLIGSTAWGQQPLKAAGQDAKPWILHAQNELSGLAVDLTRAISKQIGVPIEYQAMVFADLIPAVDSGKIDVIATNMAITPAREQKVDFSRPYYNALSEALVAQSSDATPYRTLADLKGPPVGAQKGSTQLALLQSASSKPRAAFAVPKGNHELLEKINTAIAALEADGLKSIFDKYGLNDWAPPK